MKNKLICSKFFVKNMLIYIWELNLNIQNILQIIYNIFSDEN
jgi:hypothetical protein